MKDEHYFPTVNALRAIAALMVCIFHFTNYSDFRGDFFSNGGVIQNVGQYGKLGVYVFFVITGFVIPLSMFKYDFKLNKTHKFLMKRWVRIEIPYLFSILLVIGVLLAFGFRNHTAIHIDPLKILHHVMYTSEFFNVEWYNPIYWTLAIEMQFYLLIVLLYPLLKFKNRSLNAIAPLVLGISPLFIDDTCLVFHYGAIFSVGLFLYLALTKKIPNVLAVFGILLMVYITVETNGIEIATTAILTAMVIAFVHIDKRTFNWLGDISYSLYLTHGLIGVNLIYFVGRYTDSTFSKLSVTAIALVLSLFFAFIYWKFIENPTKKLSKNIRL